MSPTPLRRTKLVSTTIAPLDEPNGEEPVAKCPLDSSMTVTSFDVDAGVTAHNLPELVCVGNESENARLHHGAADSPRMRQSSGSITPHCPLSSDVERDAAVVNTPNANLVSGSESEGVFITISLCTCISSNLHSHYAHYDAKTATLGPTRVCPQTHPHTLTKKSSVCIT